MISVSYLVTVHNEDITLRNLLTRLTQCIETTQCKDEIVILDDFSDNLKTKEVLSEFTNKPYIRVFQHALDKNYGAHKNFGNEKCANDWIFQIDGDELPSEVLLANLSFIIETNPTIELFIVPRINDFKGVTPEIARQWGWRLEPCPIYDNRPIVNWPDPQGRIYKRDPQRIKFLRRLHEKIEGYDTFASLPFEYDFALYHDKTIETQVSTNRRYNEWFTEEENKGHGGFVK